MQFQALFQAAAMKSLLGIGRHFLQHFVVRPIILGKVAKAFQQLSSGLGAPGKRSVWGYFLPPPPFATGGLTYQTNWAFSVDTYVHQLARVY